MVIEYAKGELNDDDNLDDIENDEELHWRRKAGGGGG